MASTLEGIPPIISKVVPRVELSEEYKGKQFNSRIRFGPNRLEFIEFERSTILGGCPQFWTPFKGTPTCIAPTIIVAAPGKDLRLVHDLTFANKITERLREVSFNMIAIFRFILELYCKHIEEGGDPLILLGDLVKAFRQMRCEDPDNVLIFECLPNPYQYRTVPVDMTDSTYFLAATLQDVLKDFIDLFLQLFADNYIGVAVATTFRGNQHCSEL